MLNALVHLFGVHKFSFMSYPQIYFFFTKPLALSADFQYQETESTDSVGKQERPNRKVGYQDE